MVLEMIVIGSIGYIAGKFHLIGAFVDGINNGLDENKSLRGGGQGVKTIKRAVCKK